MCLIKANGDKNEINKLKNYNIMKLFLIHVGFYDPDIMEGLYEQHSNYFVVAENIKEAKNKARGKPIYKRKKMHIDGIQELNVIEGYRVKFVKDDLKDDMVIYNYNDGLPPKSCTKC